MACWQSRSHSFAQKVKNILSNQLAYWPALHALKHRRLGVSSAGWDVVGVSRRKPELPSGLDSEFLSVDLRDEEAARAAFEPLTDITHIAYTALHEKPALVAG